MADPRMSSDPELAATVRLRESYRDLARRNLARFRRLPAANRYRATWNGTLTLVVCQGCRQGCRSCCRVFQAMRTMNDTLLRRLLRFAAQHFHNVSITGGEPTECLDLVVDAVRPYPDLRVNLTTHGEALPDAMVAALAAAPNIYPTVSLNGVGPVHDQSRRSGSFAKVRQTLDKLRAAGVPFGILAVVNHANVAQILSGELADFVDAIGACTLEFFQYYPIGSGVTVDSPLILKAPEMAASLAYRRDLAAGGYGFDYRWAQKETDRCRRALQVHVDGRVSYCPFSCWGFESVAATDTDATIRAKLERHGAAWAALASHSPAHCPLQSNVAGYVDFFRTRGVELSPPTGILDAQSPVHALYRDRAAATPMLAGRQDG